MTKAGIKFLMQMHNKTMAFMTFKLKLLLNEIKASTSMHHLCCQEVVGQDNEARFRVLFWL